MDGWYSKDRVNEWMGKWCCKDRKTEWMNEWRMNDAVKTKWMNEQAMINSFHSCSLPDRPVPTRLDQLWGLKPWSTILLSSVFFSASPRGMSLQHITQALSHLSSGPGLWACYTGRTWLLLIGPIRVEENSICSFSPEPLGFSFSSPLCLESGTGEPRLSSRPLQLTTCLRDQQEEANGTLMKFRVKLNLEVLQTAWRRETGLKRLCLGPRGAKVVSSQD